MFARLRRSSALSYPSMMNLLSFATRALPTTVVRSGPTSSKRYANLSPPSPNADSHSAKYSVFCFGKGLLQSSSVISCLRTTLSIPFFLRMAYHHRCKSQYPIQRLPLYMRSSETLYSQISYVVGSGSSYK